MPSSPAACPSPPTVCRATPCDVAPGVRQRSAELGDRVAAARAASRALVTAQRGLLSARRRLVQDRLRLAARERDAGPPAAPGGT